MTTTELNWIELNWVCSCQVPGNKHTSSSAPQTLTVTSCAFCQTKSAERFAFHSAASNVTSISLQSNHVDGYEENTGEISRSSFLWLTNWLTYFLLFQAHAPPWLKTEPSWNTSSHKSFPPFCSFLYFLSMQCKQLCCRSSFLLGSHRGGDLICIAINGVSRSNNSN